MRKEIIPIIKILEKEDPSVISMEESIIELLDGQGDPYSYRDSIKKDIIYTNNNHPNRQPSFSLYLAIVHMILEDNNSAKKALSHAALGFHMNGNTLNEAVTEWLFGIIHFDNGEIIRSEQAYKKARELIETLRRECQLSNKWEQADKYGEYLEQIRIFHEEAVNSKQQQLSLEKNAKAEGKSLLSRFTKPRKSMKPELTDFRTNDPPKISETGDRNNQGGPPEKGDTPKRGRRYNHKVEHIIIPVDLQALQDENPTLNILEPELFEDLKKYEKNIDMQNGQVKTTKAQNVRLKRIIPPLPIYGQTAAGPDGIPNLDTDELEMAPEVYEDLHIRFGENEFEVESITSNKVTIIDGRRYGWLEVLGESMNKTNPNPIKNGDYVLFIENHDTLSCVSKIVIAGLPEAANQRPQLVVKKLMRLSDAKTKKTRYILRSVSTLNFKDIDIVNEHQIAGEVIAVARPI